MLSVSCVHGGGESACITICTGVMARPLSLAMELESQLVRTTTSRTAKRRQDTAIVVVSLCHGRLVRSRASFRDGGSRHSARSA